MIEADAIDCMVALPGQLFYSTQIPACLWFLARDKAANGHRDRRGEILFIDARKLGAHGRPHAAGVLAGRYRKIAETYHRWRAKGADFGLYEDVPGFCKSAKVEDIAKHGFVLTPGRYVGAADVEDDGGHLKKGFPNCATLS